MKNNGWSLAFNDTSKWPLKSINIKFHLNPNNVPTPEPQKYEVASQESEPDDI